jgi:hypothetical protein
MARLGTGHSNTGETDEANETNEINEVMNIYAVSIYESCSDCNIVHLKKKRYRGISVGEVTLFLFL